MTFWISSILIAAMVVFILYVFAKETEKAKRREKFVDELMKKQGKSK